jgi:exodeoxyribonuclease VII large subunit
MPIQQDRELYTVSEITRRIKTHLEGGFPSVAVQGELSNVRLHSSGHLYFTLKDEYAQLAGVMWRSRVGVLSFQPEDGMRVVVTGRLAVYEVRGVYQVDATAIRPMGTGELQKRFEELKRKLAAEGLFDAAKKKRLPVFPETIGIVTSPTGAALQDILHILRRRFSALTVVLAPARVQGAGAAGEIAAAVRDLNEWGRVDVIILTRGGGSLEDLWAFNEEVVARAVAGSLIPVVSAVGHEIDVTIADFAADLRAPTPSAAAELVVRDRREILDILRESSYRMQQSVQRVVTRRRDTIRHLLRSHGINRPVDLHRQFSQRLDELVRAFRVSSDHAIELRRTRLTGLRDRVAALNPSMVLRRGYAIISREGRIVSSRAVLRQRDTIDVRFHDGSVRSTVTGEEP